MKKWKRYLPIGMLALVLVAVGMLTLTVQAVETTDGVVPYRVYFGTISGGGKAKEDVVAEIEAYVEDVKDTKVILAAGNNKVETTAGELGITWGNPEVVDEAERLGKTGNLIKRYKEMKDLENEDKVFAIKYNVDAEKVEKIINDNLESFNTEVVDTGLKKVENGFEIVPGIQGVVVNVPESVTAVEDYFFNLWNGETSQVDLAASVVEPRGTEEELSLVKDVLGSYKTSFATSAAGRVANVTNGSSKIDGSVIYPGEEFSVHEAVSPFTPENGYKLAGAYENGQTVDSYGGGICQVSTTLYNAVIRAELEIVQRYAHSMIVTYVDPSADAAIAGDYKDFKFKNNTDAPIYIESYTSGRVLYFTIYGHETRPDNREISFVSETLSTTDPGVEFKAVDAPIGTITKTQSSHTGMKSRLWKVVKVDGVEESREIFNNSTYSPSPTKYEVGISSIYPEAVANMQAAIATQDEATIRAAAAMWNDEAIAARQQPDVVPTPEPTPIPTPDPTPTPEPGPAPVQSKAKKRMK